MVKFSTSVYAAALGVADNIFLGTLVPYYVYSWTGNSDMYSKVWNGKLYLYLYYTSCYISVWLVVAMSVDRLIIVRFPLHAARLCSIKKTKIAIAVIYLAVFIPCIYMLVFTDDVIILDSGSFPTFTDKGAELYQYRIVPWVDVVFYLLVPLSLMCFTNILIVHELRKISRIKLVETPQGFTGKSKSGKPKHVASKTEIQMTVMATTICVAFFVFMIPLFITYVAVWAFGSELSEEESVAWNNALAITVMLPAANSGTNFLLYCFAGRKFREELVELFSCCKRQIRTGESAQSANSSNAIPSIPSTHFTAVSVDGKEKEVCHI